MSRPLQPGPRAKADRAVTFFQATADPRRIYSVVTGEDGNPLAYGPVVMDWVSIRAFAYPYSNPTLPPGSPDLAADILARPANFHHLDDYFHVYGYPADVIEWIESTPADGREYREVATRLNLDQQRLWEAGLFEGEVQGARDPAGDTLFHSHLGVNWAVSITTGHVSINPNAYRFKAWLSLEEPVS